MENIITELKAVLVTTPGRWLTLSEHFSESSLRRRPAPGEWSALECLLHLIDLDRGIFPQRVQAILDGEDFPAFFPDEDGSSLREDVSAESLAAEFDTLRRENLKLLNRITLPDLSKTATHAELGSVTLGHLLHEWGGHDLMHLVQAEQALMQPFIEGCGAWEVYFMQHKATQAANMKQVVDTKAELLEYIARDWVAINTLLDGLKDSQWTAIRNSDGWAVKDHITHLTAWHRYVIAILTGKPRHEGLGVPEAVYMPKDIDAINAAIFQQHHHEPLEQVRSEFQATHHALMRLIEPMTDEELMKPYRDFLPDHPDESDAPIIDTIYGDTAFHYREHQSWIETMLR